MVFFAQGLSEGRVGCQDRSPAERGPVAGTESAIGAGSESATSVKDKRYNHADKQSRAGGRARKEWGEGGAHRGWCSVEVGGGREGCQCGCLSGALGLRSGFEPPDLDRPGRQLHQRGLSEARLVPYESLVFGVYSLPGSR